MDTLSKSERSARMSLVRSTDTKPELLVRRLVHGLGYRYRLHVPKLPGRPDIVFPRMRKVIFVHGCFWHRHPRCHLARLPKSKLSFWVPKLTLNRRRDVLNIRRLRHAGWQVEVIWECQIEGPELLQSTIAMMFGAKRWTIWRGEWTRDWQVERGVGDAKVVE
jgi:DNA mismatch endonuclease, patch repair protein